MMLTELNQVTESNVRGLGVAGIYLEVPMCWVFHGWLYSTGVTNSRDLKDFYFVYASVRRPL